VLSLLGLYSAKDDQVAKLYLLNFDNLAVMRSTPIRRSELESKVDVVTGVIDATLCGEENLPDAKGAFEH